MLNEETIKQIFFQSDRPRKDPLMADEVDIMQFAHNIELYVAAEYARKEHERCVEIVKYMNEEVGKSLENKKPNGR
jgi:late competence protein required for DNA uptake (superfamily II DNA/RNA helicase)